MLLFERGVVVTLTQMLKIKDDENKGFRTSGKICTKIIVVKLLTAITYLKKKFNPNRVKYDNLPLSRVPLPAVTLITVVPTAASSEMLAW